MTRRELCIRWLNNEMTDEEVREQIRNIPVPELKDVDNLAEMDSWYDGDMADTAEAISALRNRYDTERVREFFEKFW